MWSSRFNLVVSKMKSLRHKWQELMTDPDKRKPLVIEEVTESPLPELHGSLNMAGHKVAYYREPDHKVGKEDY